MRTPFATSHRPHATTSRPYAVLRAAYCLLIPPFAIASSASTACKKTGTSANRLFSAGTSPASSTMYRLNEYQPAPHEPITFDQPPAAILLRLRHIGVLLTQCIPHEVNRPWKMVNLTV
ncbi:hypothetical protein C8R44DRAFT_877123 [Mycena epipterygia]|nr:hypothetical protein C8R44DRAFT_877123 [Mycena epipterygia]